jgi:hypothetical protein
MRRAFLVGVILLGIGIAGRAHAQVQTYTWQERLRGLDLPTVNRGSGQWGFAGFVQSMALLDAATHTTSTIDGDFAAGGEVAYAAKECRYFVFGGHGRVTLESGTWTPSGEQWISSCLAHGAFLSLRIGSHLEWDVRPSFDSPRTLLAETFRRETVWLTYTLFDAETLLKGDSHVLILSATPRLTFTSQAALAKTVLDAQVDVVAVRAHFHHGKEEADRLGRTTLDFLRARLDRIDHTVSSLALRSSLVAVEGAPLRTAILGLDGDIGYSLATLAQQSITLRSVSGFTGSLGLRLLRDAYTAGLRWDRGVVPTIDQRLASEDRITLWGTIAPAHLTLRFFGARTKAFGAMPPFDDNLTFGGAADFAIDVRHAFHFGITAEAARTFYGSLLTSVTGTGPVPTDAVRVLAVLSARFGTH